MTKSEEVSKIGNDYEDSDFKKYTIFMCKKCKFYKNNSCSKRRIIRNCAKQGLKDKE